ncbi:CidA/LrgA family protein [Aquibacillus salsiterrae]|uniref:CidA/LrgA family holin-like protein n=1 Tax=Aquibacillus salsiterrae TaxID=2950439 RepID=A0A9X3WIV4_9BACI|nr:CidA/LrgA family holin-like protein [Aquibacillus salsiterrae]MDC3418189.1 CidA/LrgA family holin-like protein [Aquibacillus salsiterrae]
MNIFKISLHITLLYCFYLIGVWIQTTFNLFIPGSIIGMLLFFLLLATNVLKDSWIETGTKTLLNHMPLLFVPVTVGIINYLGFFSGKGLLLVFIVILSTAIVMISAGWLALLLLKGKVDTHD